ncbi:MAG: hypothetical protein GQ564_20040 [Bacteroidales bacterium]|nr:hypothetical protein [Bacteroidales bacterium]
MRKIIVTLLLIIISIGAYSQDIITRTNGEILKCKIQNEDSTFVYFKIFIKDKLIETHLPTSEISSIKYYSTSTVGIDNIIEINTKHEVNAKVEVENEVFASLVVGLGLDYGGVVGFKLKLNLHDNFGIFGGLGWAFLGYGYNVGAKVNFAPKSKINPHLQAMYGYNAGIIIDNDSDLSKIFYGGTVGFGIDFKSTKRKSYWTLGLLIPIRKEEVNEYMDYLEDEKNVEFQADLKPILLSIGFTF